MNPITRKEHVKISNTGIGSEGGGGVVDQRGNTIAKTGQNEQEQRQNQMVRKSHLLTKIYRRVKRVSYYKKQHITHSAREQILTSRKHKPL